MYVFGYYMQYACGNRLLVKYSAYMLHVSLRTEGIRGGICVDAILRGSGAGPARARAQYLSTTVPYWGVCPNGASDGSVHVHSDIKISSP